MDDYDGPWKEALELYFRVFLLLLFRDIHDDIDWTRPVEWLDKELQQLRPKAARGRRTVDKLAKVWRKNGKVGYVLIHIEIQAWHDAGLARRVCVYNTRLFDAFDLDVVSLVVLADDNPRWRPQRFRRGLWGCTVNMRFRPVKLLDFVGREAELEASDNPFAHFLLAHLQALRTRENLQDRMVWKVRIARNLFDRGFNADDVRQLFKLIDWVMKLPEALDKDAWDEVAAYQETKQMAFLTLPERIARADTTLKLTGAVLRDKFGDNGAALLPTIEALEDTEKYEAMLLAAARAKTLDDVRRAVAEAAAPPKKKGKAKKSGG